MTLFQLHDLSESAWKHPLVVDNNVLHVTEEKCVKVSQDEQPKFKVPNRRPSLTTSMALTTGQGPAINHGLPTAAARLRSQVMWYLG
jgi:hypothetical protein